jgi:Protein of unknown function (DUF1566)
MNALAKDFRRLLIDRLERASSSELLSIVSTLCANDDAATVRPPKSITRFTKLDSRSNPVTDSSDWVAVHDSQTQLIWAKDLLECDDVSWADAKKAAGNHHLLGAEDWRLPTVKEWVSIFDYSRFGPALDTTYFSKDTNWCWTSNVDAESPSDYAWFVGLLAGYVLRSTQTLRARVRAVRASQNLNFSF